MAEVTNDLIFETLKAMQDRLARIDARLERLGDRFAHVGRLMGDLVKNDLSRNAEAVSLERRVARIERRLDLRDADA